MLTSLPADQGMSQEHIQEHSQFGKSMNALFRLHAVVDINSIYVNRTVFFLYSKLVRVEDVYFKDGLDIPLKI